MNYDARLKNHYSPKKGWMNDPNGLCEFDGYYHAFYQFTEDYEQPWYTPMTWGHARTKDFKNWEELPVALYADKEYDIDGCWSGTAIEYDGVLYLFYASVIKDGDKLKQSVSMAYSKDGINFVKYKNNPIIKASPKGCSVDFRDPAIMKYRDGFCLVVASGDEDNKEGRLLLYKSKNLIDWEYSGIISRWDSSKYCECPSFMPYNDKFMLATSVVAIDNSKRFCIMYGDFDGEKFVPEIIAEPFKGPDQYAGQAFLDNSGRHIFITWLPGWEYAEFYKKSIGCLSLPLELVVKDGKIIAIPIKETENIGTTDDEYVKLTNEGFVIYRTAKPDVVCKTSVKDMKIIRDEYIIEIYVNGGEEVYSVVLC